MHDREFQSAFVFYPKEIALERLPLGLPSGTQAYDVSVR